jgi:hypothetical protein
MVVVALLLKLGGLRVAITVSPEEEEVTLKEH